MSWLEDDNTPQTDAPLQTAPAPDPYAQQQGDMYAQPAPDPFATPAEGGDMYAQPQGEMYAQPAEQAPMHADPYASATQPAAMPAAPAAPMAGGELSVQPPVLDEVYESANPQTPRGELSSLVLDVEVPVEVCFGDAAMSVEQFLELGPGSVVELERELSAPIELRVRGKLVARGQLVTINGNYGLRITETVKQS